MNRHHGEHGVGQPLVSRVGEVPHAVAEPPGEHSQALLGPERDNAGGDFERGEREKDIDRPAAGGVVPDVVGLAAAAKREQVAPGRRCRESEARKARPARAGESPHQAKGHQRADNVAEEFVNIEIARIAREPIAGKERPPASSEIPASVRPRRVHDARPRPWRHQWNQGAKSRAHQRRAVRRLRASRGNLATGMVPNTRPPR